MSTATPARFFLPLAVFLLTACSPGDSGSAGPPPAIYTSSCAPCHADGLGGAPIVGDSADWETRVAKGMRKVRENGINGFEGATGLMPPKGGRTDLSDEEINSLVDYMVEASR